MLPLDAMHDHMARASAFGNPFSPAPRFPRRQGEDSCRFPIDGYQQTFQLHAPLGAVMKMVEDCVGKTYIHLFVQIMKGGKKTKMYGIWIASGIRTLGTVIGTHNYHPNS